MSGGNRSLLHEWAVRWPAEAKAMLLERDKAIEQRDELVRFLRMLDVNRLWAEDVAKLNALLDKIKKGEV